MATIAPIVNDFVASDVTDDVATSGVANFNLAFYYVALAIAKLFGCINAEAKSSFWDAYPVSHRVMRKYLFGARAMLSLCSRTRLESRLAQPLNTYLPRPPVNFIFKSALRLRICVA